MLRAPQVLIVSSQNWLGLSRTPALFHRAGAEVTLMAPPGGPTAHSRHVRRLITVPLGRATTAPTVAHRVAAVIDALRLHLLREQYAWVILADDPLLAALAEHPGEDWVRAIYPVDLRSPAARYIASKAALAEAAPRFGVPVPPSRVCRTLDEATAAAEQIGFPVMLKAHLGSAGDGVRRADNLLQLADAFESMRLRVPIVLQAFVAGRVGSAEVLFDHGRPACFFNAYKTQSYPANGPSCVRTIVDYPACEEMLARIGRMTGFHGLCGVDWIEDADGRHYVLELNARPTPAYQHDHLAGISFSRGLAAILAGQTLTQRPRRAGRRGPTIYMFPQHPIACIGRHQRCCLLRWLPFAALHDTPWSDPPLLAWHLHHLAPMLAASIWGSIRRKCAIPWTSLRHPSHAAPEPRPAAVR